MNKTDEKVMETLAALCNKNEATGIFTGDRFEAGWIAAYKFYNMKIIIQKYIKATESFKK